MKLQMKTAEREEKQKMTITDFDTHLLHERTAALYHTASALIKSRPVQIKCLIEVSQRHAPVTRHLTRISQRYDNTWVNVRDNLH